MSHHNYTPEIEPKESPVQGFIITVACLAVFAFIGVLLAWRGWTTEREWIMFNCAYVKTYHTQTGFVGAEIWRDKQGRYAYIGKWGAGSGIDADTMQNIMKEWERTKRKYSIQLKDDEGSYYSVFPDIKETKWPSAL